MQRGSGGANVLPLLDLLLNVAPPHFEVGLYRVLARPGARVIATAYKVLILFLL